MRFILLLLLSVCTTLSVFAQDKKEEVEKKAKDKTEQRVDQKVDNAIDEGLDAVENLFRFGKKKKKKKNKDGNEESTQNTENADQQQANDMLNAMFGGGEVEIADEYTFDSDMLVEMTTTKKNGNKEEAREIRYLFSEEEKYMGYQMDNPEQKQEAVKVVMDWNTGAMLTFMEEQKQIMVINLNMEAIEETVANEMEKSETEDAMGSFQKTGKTKEILGYTCQEYTYENEETKGSMWVTDEVDMGFAKMMGNMSSAIKEKQKALMPEDFPQGSMLEGSWTNLKNGEVTTWITKELNVSKNTAFSTKGYQVMSFGNMFNSKE